MNLNLRRAVAEYPKYLDARTDEYLKELDNMDKQEESEDNMLSVKQEEVKRFIEKAQREKEEYSELSFSA